MAEYLTDKGVSQYLFEAFKELEIPKDAEILEIGCNAGRNLNYFYENGYNNLHGIEISHNAVKLIKKHFPEMHSNSNILLGPVEEKIKEIHDNKIQLTFTMGVLMHIHPSSNFIFNEISRVTSKYIITSERETQLHSLGEYLRDYQEVFENLGWKQLVRKDVDIPYQLDRGVVLRIFQKNS